MIMNKACVLARYGMIRMEQYAIRKSAGFPTINQSIHAFHSLARPQQQKQVLLDLSYDIIKRNALKDGHNETPKPPIIILHGLFGNKLNNRSIGRNLNKQLGRDVYLLDLRNHGSSPHSPVHNYSAMSEDVRHFIANHRLNAHGGPIIVGHSMGGKVAMMLVLKNPQLCSMMVCIENAPVSLRPNAEFVDYIRALMEIVNDNGKTIQTLKQADEYLAGRIGGNELVRRFLLTTLKRVTIDGSSPSSSYTFQERIPLSTLKDAIVKGEIAAWPLDPAHERWTGPALFIRATQSHYVVDEYLPLIGAFFPRFETRDIDAGHWVNAEKPGRCAETIADFVERHED
ncbi:AIS_HP2_G0019250.mRNA.1.CDS.1 [Saccharomyces cerevisiae]|nr:AIS_HP2_G0019250.mRNA.1.CDS.1 [Saccharomyces cerevisiae]CAI6516443.1 AIS_HP2_G0019250.mRNA.1.CDS.1 [Saccharomyces cerevisiae]